MGLDINVGLLEEHDSTHKKLNVVRRGNLSDLPKSAIWVGEALVLNVLY